MTPDTFKNALTLATDFNTPLTLGGGEPLLNPFFFDFLWASVRACSSDSFDAGFSYVGVVTNGKCEKEAIELANLASIGLVFARLSLDQFHEPVSERVKRAFGWPKHPRSNEDRRDYRDFSGEMVMVTPAGRARRLSGYPPTYHKCFCNSVLVVPNGDVFQCGHKDVCFGNVNNYSLLALPEGFEEILSEDICSRDKTSDYS